MSFLQRFYWPPVLGPHSLQHRILLLGVLFVPGAILEAAPIAFRFDATITEVDGDPSPLNLPFSLSVGQQIAGKYSFQSEEDFLDVFLHPDRDKRGLLTLTIDGSELEARTNRGVLGDRHVSFSYSSPTNALPGWGGFFAGHWWDPLLFLYGDEGTLSSPEDILNITAWNQLKTFRQLHLKFGYDISRDLPIVTVLASVGDLTVVPEPPTFIYLAGAACLVRGTRHARTALLGTPLCRKIECP
jgi:hypothetical protein